MADAPEDDELLLTDEVEEESETEEEEGQGSDEAGDEADEELEVTFGNEAAPASGERDTDLVKHLREEIRRRDKELADARRNQSAPRKVEVGERPTLESCDYDEDKLAAEVEAWVQRKAEASQAETESQKREREANEQWQTELRSYQAKRAELKFPDVQEVEELATGALDQVQQAVIVKVADNPALVLYSLGKHPQKLGELAKISDPLKLAAAVAKLEGTLKVTTRRKAPEPEQIERGNARVSQGSDKTLERLEKQADKTGDRSELVAYRRRLKSKA